MSRAEFKPYQGIIFFGLDRVALTSPKLSSFNLSEDEIYSLSRMVVIKSMACGVTWKTEHQVPEEERAGCVQVHLMVKNLGVRLRPLGIHEVDPTDNNF